MYLNTLSVKKLIPEMLTPYDLQALLDIVIEDLKSHPKLRLPVEPTKKYGLQILSNYHSISNHV